MISIGIIENNEKYNLTKILLNYFRKRGERLLHIEKDNNTNFTKNSMEWDYLVVEMNMQDIINNKYSNIEFNIILENTQDNTSINIENLQKIILNIKKGGYFIFNSDYINKISFKCNDLYPITYGLNGKVTVTASSINDFENLEFSICLQRTVLTIYGDVVQPFERPIIVDATRDELYNYLAAFTCIITLGYKF